MARSALLFSFAVGCQAWGPDGHTIVAHIADNLLDPKVHEVLTTDLGSTSLSDASAWCDAFDHSPAGRWSEPLHFINYPGQACSFNYARDCKNDMCNVGALMNYSGQVFDRTTSKTDRLFALKFVIHMMGDLHQPMHVASNDDRGGNNIKVNVDFTKSAGLLKGHHGKRQENLHHVWDTSMVMQIISELTQEQQANGAAKNEDNYHNWQVLSNFLVQRLKNEWNQNATEWRKVVAEDRTNSVMLRGGLLTAHRNVTLLRAGLEWVATRTASVGCSNAYVSSKGGKRIQSGDHLGRDYFEFARPTIEVQLAKGGARLAQLLSDSLALSSIATSQQAIVTV